MKIWRWKELQPGEDCVGAGAGFGFRSLTRNSDCNKATHLERKQGWVRSQ